MSLTRFVVKKLFGKYNYDISFNRDITLIYGMNGCGKTTLLNLVTSIITASIYKLFSYDFDSLSLYYNKDDGSKDIYNIYIIKKEDILILRLNDEEYIIKEYSILSERAQRSFHHIEEYYMKNYPILLDIKSEFNSVYLALNRASQLTEDNDLIFLKGSYVYRNDEILQPEQFTPEIRYVENLIMKKYLKVSSDVNIINTKFRDDILKKITNLEIFTTQGKIFEKIKRFSTDEVNEISESYIRILDDFGLIKNKEETRYKQIFERYIEYSKSNKNSADNIILDFICSYELTRIQEIVKQAAAAEKSKGHAYKSLNLFVETVNEFIKNSGNDKKLDIDSNGRVFFSSNGDEKKLSIEFLSSGEKQLVIFFANLIFSVSPDKSGIFVVDEPELSLHLSWQKVFIQKALKVNPKAQLIFATHAPEIVGKYREKMKKLEREIIK